MTYKLIIFDLDGTLADTAPDLLATLNRVTIDYDLAPVTRQVFGQIIGQGAKAMISKAFELNNQALDTTLLNTLFDSFLEDYSANIANETRLYENLIEAMDALTAKGFEFSICTNKTERMARILLEELSVTSRFKSITGGDTFDFRKPDKRHLIETAKLAGYPISDAIMIGDSTADINAAHNAQIPSVAVTFGYCDIAVEELNATQIISNYKMLPAAIESICETSTS